MEVRILSGAPSPHPLSRPRSPLVGTTACRAVRGGFDPRRGRQVSTHQGRLTGRARGPEPRDGGSSPSPGTNFKPDLAKWEGGGRQNRHDRVRFAGSGPNSWSSSERYERHVETVRRRRLETVLQRHSRVAQRLEQLVYTQKVAGSSPCLGNHTLVAYPVRRPAVNRKHRGSSPRQGAKSGDGRARSKARGPDPRERRFESSSPDHAGVAQLRQSARLQNVEMEVRVLPPVPFLLDMVVVVQRSRALDCGSSDVGSTPIDHPKCGGLAESG